jgi:protein-S-isoprenylcysteine O-methyltransferase Ste14
MAQKWSDLSSRAIVISFFLLVGWIIGRDLMAMLQREHIEIIRVASKASVLAFYVLVAWLILIRSQPIAKAKGWQPRISALVGSNLFFFGVPFLVPKSDLSPTLYATSALFVIGGGIAATYSLSYLGRSFSIMAQARRLVTDGPYRFVRHPLYLAEFISYLGVFIQYASWISAALLVVQCGFQIRRMLNEEALLQMAFPEYAGYATHRARFLPGVW